MHKHYENTPIQIYWKFYNQKTDNFQIKNSDIFHIPAQNIDGGYSLEPPRRVFAGRTCNLVGNVGRSSLFFLSLVSKI